MPVFVRSQHGPHGLSLRRLRTRARRMLHALDRDDAELSIVLVDDIIIQALNTAYRHKERPTDVLSFAMSEGEFGDLNPGVLGDVVISVPTARKQAKRAKRDVFDEVTFLLAHGLLHLVGFDHDSDEQDREMKRQTRRLMAAARDPRPLRS
ncbi:MAG: rRNA maturation RNase YbeY [Myxococcota bacterium]